MLGDGYGMDANAFIPDAQETQVHINRTKLDKVSKRFIEKQKKKNKREQERDKYRQNKRKEVQSSLRKSQIDMEKSWSKSRYTDNTSGFNNPSSNRSNLR